MLWEQLVPDERLRLTAAHWERYHQLASYPLQRGSQEPPPSTRRCPARAAEPAPRRNRRLRGPAPRCGGLRRQRPQHLRPPARGGAPDGPIAGHGRRGGIAGVARMARRADASRATGMREKRACQIHPLRSEGLVICAASTTLPPTDLHRSPIIVETGLVYADRETRRNPGRGSAGLRCREPHRSPLRERRARSGRVRGVESRRHRVPRKNLRAPRSAARRVRFARP